MARASATAGPPEFLARERELEHLLALFEDASSGATRFAVVTGEPGIGKTRLVTEVCARLTDRASDHWASCYEGQPSHWCWIKLLQELDSPPQVTDEAARFDSLVALAGALGAAAEVQPLLLVLDDVHLADEASLGALSFVSRELRGSPIMLMAAYRDVEVRRGHPLAKTLGELAREQLAERITLTGLSADSVARLLESTAGLDPSAVALELHERTHGNPLFVGEFGRLAAAAGAFDAGRLPEGIRDVIGLRLDRLDESQVALLRTAAVIGESFAASQLSTVAEEPDPGPALRPAVDVGLLALAEDLRSYRFTWDADRCVLEDGVMVTRTAPGREQEVEFTLYPALTSAAEVDLEVELRRQPGDGQVVLSAGFGVAIANDSVRLAQYADTDDFDAGPLEDVHPWTGATGATTTQASLDTSEWHTYRLERRPSGCRLLVDGKQLLASDDPSLKQRYVRFGAGGELEAHWRAGSARVHNPQDYSIDWSWESAKGFPDQFQRDRVVVLDYTSDSGYSDWTQLQYGTIVVADYSSDNFRNINSGGPQPVLKAYRLQEEDLL